MVLFLPSSSWHTLLRSGYKDYARILNCNNISKIASILFLLLERLFGGAVTEVASNTMGRLAVQFRTCRTMTPFRGTSLNMVPLQIAAEAVIAAIYSRGAPAPDVLATNNENNAKISRPFPLGVWVKASRTIFPDPDLTQEKYEAWFLQPRLVSASLVTCRTHDQASWRGLLLPPFYLRRTKNGASRSSPRIRKHFNKSWAFSHNRPSAVATLCCAPAWQT